jgi:hypothetical protein
MAQRGSDRAAGKEPAPVPSVTAPAVTAPSVTAPSVTAPSVTAPSVTAPSVTAPSVTAKCWHGGSYLGAPPVNARADLAQGGWGAKSKEDAVLRCRFLV